MVDDGRSASARARWRGSAALEVKRSLLIVVTERHNSIVQVRAVVLLAMLAMVRKLIVLDLATTAGRLRPLP